MLEAYRTWFCLPCLVSGSWLALEALLCFNRRVKQKTWLAKLRVIAPSVIYDLGISVMDFDILRFQIIRKKVWVLGDAGGRLSVNYQLLQVTNVFFPIFLHGSIISSARPRRYSDPDLLFVNKSHICGTINRQKQEKQCDILVGL